MKFRFDIAKRISAGYIVILFISIVATASCLLAIQNNRDKYDELANVHLPFVTDLKEFSSLINDSKKLSNDWIYQPSPEGKARLNQLQDKDYPTLKTGLGNIRDKSIDRQTQQAITSLITDFDSVVAKQNRITQLLRTDNDYANDSTVDLALDILNLHINPETKIISNHLDKTLAQENTTLNLLRDQLNKSFFTMSLILILLLSVILIIGVLARVYAYRGIVNPIVQINKIIGELGKGEIPDVSVSARNDELGEMNNAIASMTKNIRIKAEFANQTGKKNYDLDLKLLSENDLLGNALIAMRDDLKSAATEENTRNWVNAGITQLNEIIRADQDNQHQLYFNLIAFIVRYLNATQGGMFVFHGEDAANMHLELVSCYAYNKVQLEKKKILVGEGMVGQVALEKKSIYLKNIPADYFKITSGLGETPPIFLLIVPLLFDESVRGVIEIASLNDFSELHREFIDRISKNIASSIDLISRKARTENLLRESQQLNERLKAQEEELRVSNEELTEKTQLLQSSEEELKVQQEELLQTNNQIEEKARLLTEQNEEVRIKNEELETARTALKIKAEELELASKYKSEFLANMSHELRTPLNSILILSKLLSENKNGNLDIKQLEFAGVIQKSGSDLLSLINDILDLSKIESRKITLEIEEVNLDEVSYSMHSLFDELANDKKIHFNIDVDKDLPQHFHSDKMRLEQIIKNMLSNAFKFTEKGGSIELKISKTNSSTTFMNPELHEQKDVIAFLVADTGIGIPKEKQQQIFEAFQQADGSTSRKYGGTGLGLSISRELSFMLGGEMHVESTPGAGSTFTLFLPSKFTGHISEEQKTEVVKEQPQQMPLRKSFGKSATALADFPFEDDRTNISDGDKVILIIEDDEWFAKMLMSHAHERKFKAVIANRGDTGLEAARYFKPHAIVLDIKLPVMNGWEVIRNLKQDPELKNIPVHVITGSDIDEAAKKFGAIEILIKPITSNQLNGAFDKIKNEITSGLKHVLVIEDNIEHANAIKELLKRENLECAIASTGKEAIEALDTQLSDVIILDLSLPDISGMQLLKQIKEDPKWTSIPIIVYTGKILSSEEEKILSNYSSAVILKSQKSYERLLDETTLFLRKIQKGGMAPVNSSGREAVSVQLQLKGKKVLVVDDDMRNVFALNSALESQEMKVMIANDGNEALQRLEEEDHVDIVLMDIMMPEMDGYEAMRHIRKMEKHKKLPIIALTAKAMKGDREKCIEAGASDYIAKPVDISKLLSLMRVWLYK